MTTTESITTTLEEGPDEVTLNTAAIRARPLRKRRRSKIRTPLAGRIAKWLVLAVVAVVMLVPLYVMIISAFKPQADILQNPLGFSPDSFTLEYLMNAVTSEKFNVIGAYGITLLFVLLVNVFCILLSAPAAYVIARGRRKWHMALLLVFVSGLFIPGQVTLIPVVFVLRMLGLIGTIPGFVLFETALTLPITIFLFTAYLRSVPRDIDEAAALDGAGKIRAFWSCIFPIMKPVVATIVVLNSISVWNDFVNPQVILGPSSGIYTVTTGVYAAVGQYATDYTTVFPTLLLAVTPAIIFFIVMQRYIIGGLVAGATKG
ncbi:raffinose/stachyose/melibiose transport system permease protein [Agromyces hippuratus]|uniref:Raffinose/stachyose/melibiose transport system permease protein n=1 Tax=Agromyces hippuratus TaxID=286438 RepID=A0A852X924_9MICO|nr:carbohydrate ABC transporter permease [Agromyces hippuratus]NYG22431.1 raffinose/stachyose/melibiose transport system permease protein [Agromyces hippuratus]